MLPPHQKWMTTGQRILPIKKATLSNEGLDPFGKKLVPPTRIERAARGLGNRCSIQLSYGGNKVQTWADRKKTLDSCQDSREGLLENFNQPLKCTGFVQSEQA